MGLTPSKVIHNTAQVQIEVNAREGPPTIPFLHGSATASRCWWAAPVAPWIVALVGFVHFMDIQLKKKDTVLEIRLWWLFWCYINKIELNWIELNWIELWWCEMLCKSKNVMLHSLKCSCKLTIIGNRLLLHVVISQSAVMFPLSINVMTARKTVLWKLISTWLMLSGHLRSCWLWWQLLKSIIWHYCKGSCSVFLSVPLRTYSVLSPDDIGSEPD